MHEDIPLTEKYVRNGWPSLARPDLTPPDNWSLALITAVNRVRNHALSPDGAHIALIWDREDQSDVYVMAARGGWPARLSVDRGLAAYWSDEIPQWSPDSRTLAFTIDGHVHVATIDGLLPRKISDFAAGASSPVWLPDGDRLIVSVTRDKRTQLVLTDREGSWPRPLVTMPGGDAWDAQPSPDGRTVAFTWRPFADLRRLEIHLVDVAEGAVRGLTGAPGTRDWSPRWAPHGAALAFLSDRSGFTEIWLMDADGDNLRRLTQTGMDVTDIAWSPDGARIACTVNRQGSFDLAVVDVATGSLHTLRADPGFHQRPQWTPDGSFLTVEFEDPVRPADILRVDAHSGASEQLTLSNPPALAHNTLVRPTLVSYPSADGAEIPAFLFRPANPNGAAVVYPHGGPSSQYVQEWDILAQYFLAKGYTWIAPNYRGSTGYGKAFEQANYGDWGKGDAQDCLAAARFLHTLDWIDPTRIASLGGSYGGYMTACCLSRDPDYLFACGVAKYGDMELISSWAQCNRDLRLYVEIFLGHPSTNRQVYVDGSPILQVEQVQKPVLILHGLLDDVVAPETSEQWVAALQKHDKVFEYKTYAGEPHGFLMRKTQLDAYARIERFLDWYLLPGVAR